MKCNIWIIDRYSPARKKMRMEFLAPYDASEEAALHVAGQIPTEKWSVENVRRCPGNIKVIAGNTTYGEYESSYDMFEINYVCDYCGTYANDPRFMTVEDIEGYLQGLVNALERI